MTVMVTAAPLHVWPSTAPQTALLPAHAASNSARIVVPFDTHVHHGVLTDTSVPPQTPTLHVLPSHVTVLTASVTQVSLVWLRIAWQMLLR